jgi:hypothetical protein
VTLTPQPRGDMPELEVGGTTLQPAPKPAEKPADKPAPEKASEGDAKSKKQHTEDER